MRTIIIGGVAGGMSAATRLRRLDESAEIIVLERSGYVSFANCGLPYHVGGVIEKRGALLLQNPGSLKRRFGIDVRAVSYTHLDVYKRQGLDTARVERRTRPLSDPERAGRTAQVSGAP